MRVSPGFANLFNNFEAPSGTKVPLIHEMYLVIYHTLCLGGSGGIWLTSLLVIFGKPSCGVSAKSAPHKLMALLKCMPRFLANSILALNSVLNTQNAPFLLISIKFKQIYQA